MCINIDHFFLGTPKRNAEDMVEKGRSLRGERNPKAKLDEQAVREIRASSGSNPAIARRFGVSASTIHKIRTGQSWRHPIDDSPALLPVNPRKPGLCKKGHAMVEGNFYVLKNGRGRNCRQCALERGRARRLRASGFAA
jgi:DNA-binding transcriptional regulator YiaG